MRYIKVFLAIVFFYFIMLFFVQNQETLSQTMPLKLDLMFLPPMESMPLSFYTLALISFLLGGLVALLLLIWDRLSISAQCSSFKRRAKSLEKDLQKSDAALEAVKKELQEVTIRLETTERNRFTPVSSSGQVSFSDDLKQE